MKKPGLKKILLCFYFYIVIEIEQIFHVELTSFIWIIGGKDVTFNKV